MAKSPFASTPKDKIKKPAQVESPNICELNFAVKFNLKIKGCMSYNLTDWCYVGCNNKNALAKPPRIKYIKNLKKRVERLKKEQYSDDSNYSQLELLCQYIRYCDSNKISPFSKAGYLAYCGNTGELARQVALAVERKDYIFQYNDNEELGIKEGTAGIQRNQLSNIITSIGLDVMQYDFMLQDFKKNRTALVKPYSPVEWRSILRRLTFYFTSLVTQLIAFKDENPALPPPLKMKVVVDKIDGEDLLVSVGCTSKCDTSPYSSTSPFHQCMLAGYYLFSYYTAFNTTTIFDVRHPIRAIQQDKEGRASPFVRIKAYKGRSNNEIEALFTNMDEIKHPEASDEKSGFIIAEINKREKRGVMDGLAFIKIMSLFSKTYSDDLYGPLFYVVADNDKKKNVNLTSAPYVLSKNLGLYSSGRANIINHLIEIFNNLIDNDFHPKYRQLVSNETGFKYIKKEYLKVRFKAKKQRVLEIAHCILNCLTDAYLNGITMPLRFSEKNSEDKIIVSFNYAGGGKGSFYINYQYKCFLEKLQNFSHYYNPIPERCRQPNSVKKPAYLIPLGSRAGITQWDSIKGLIDKTRLNSYGVKHGDYYLNLTASRIRKTTSYLEYRDEDEGFGARQILQHTLRTQEQTYINGHPWENTKMASQGIQVLEKIAFGKSKYDAVNELKKELNISILTYEKYKKRNMPSNPNGIACDGKPNIVSEKNHHNGARRFAENEGIIEKGGSITCYQYDLCIHCKGAQIVDEPRSIYKLLSFIDAMKDSVDFYPERADFINTKVQRFHSLLAKVPLETIDKANTMLINLGRYPLFKSIDSVMQHMSIKEGREQR